VVELWNDLIKSTAVHKVDATGITGGKWGETPPGFVGLENAI